MASSWLNRSDDADLAPALFFILFIIAFYALIISFTPEFFTGLNSGMVNNSSAAASQNYDVIAGFLGSIPLGLLGAIIGFIGGYKVVGGLGLLLGGPLGFIGFSSAYQVLDASGLAEVLNRVGSNLIRIITLDVPMLNDAGDFGVVLKVLMAIFFLIAGVWIARRLMLG